MRLIFATKSILAQLSGKFRPIGIRSLCSNNKPASNNIDKKNDVVDASSSLTPYDTYKELDNLNFVKAAKILFSDPPKKKQFGLDFHLVQLFFACLPSLAVYLVAQYARYDMRRMEAELELKKKAEEEEAAAKAKEIEETSELEKEEMSDKKLLDLKARLDKLEETVKGIVVETKKESPLQIRKEPPIGSQDKQPSIAGERNTSNNSTQSGNSDAENHPNKKSTG